MGKMQDKWLGSIHKTNSGSEYKVISYNNCFDVTIEFLETGTIINTDTQRLRDGNHTDWARPKIFGVGYLGIGPFNPTKHKEAYHTWWQMINRCYNEKDKAYLSGYSLCSVSEEWYNFQNFAAFYFEDAFRQLKWQLDKDILIPGNKVYSEQTCVFLPLALNTLLARQQKPRPDNLPQGVFRMSSNPDGKYQARIMKGGKSFYLGAFSHPEEAYTVYKYEKETYVRAQAVVWEGKINPKAIKALSEWSLPDWVGN